jgi:hypothetical protein
MNIIKNYKTVIIIVLPILILVLIRSLNGNHFRNDAKKWAEPSVLRTNLVNNEQADSLAGKKLVIELGGKNNGIKVSGTEVLKIPADSILSKSNIRIINKHNGPVFLCSDDEAVSVRVWMVLSQMGHNNIYILTGSTDNEVPENRFRPDSIIRPEL